MDLRLGHGFSHNQYTPHKIGYYHKTGNAKSTTVQEAHFQQLKNSKHGFATVTAEQLILSHKLVQMSSFIF